MKKKLVLAFIFCLFCCKSSIHAQSLKNSVYVEAFGIGGYWSLNYERKFYQYGYLNISGRVGLSSYHLTDFYGKFKPDITVPIAIYAYYGNKYHVELGFGNSFSSTVVLNRENYKSERDNNVHLHFSLGYRYSYKNLVFRWGYTPILEYMKYYKNWFAISLGINI